ILLERLAYRPLRRRGSSRLAALISAIGASIFLQEFFKLVVIPRFRGMTGRGSNPVNTPHLLDRHTLFHVFSAEVRNDEMIILASALLMMVVLDQFVNRSK